jgi:hypothetical protein
MNKPELVKYIESLEAPKQFPEFKAEIPSPLIIPLKKGIRLVLKVLRA